jgi:hypothetical protein
VVAVVAVELLLEDCLELLAVSGKKVVRAVLLSMVQCSNQHRKIIMANQDLHDFAVSIDIPAGEMRAAVLVIDITGIEFRLVLTSVASDALIVGLAKNNGLPCSIGDTMNAGDILTAIVHNQTQSPISATVTWEGQENSSSPTPL